MTPLTFITGVLLGTSASIFAGLLVVILLFLLLGTNEPRVAAELPSLAMSAVLFFVMTVLCAISFIARLRRPAWTWPSQAAMWLGVAGTAAYYVL